MKLEQFVEKCKEAQIQLNKQQIEQFVTYAKMLQDWNKVMNLTGIDEFEEVLEKHFYDSLLPFFNVDHQAYLCDVGSGAGFPAIPLKIAFPEMEVVICEPTLKRVKFLNAVIEELGLNGIKCFNERAEDFVVVHREKFDIVTARAVANLQVLAELCLPLVKVNGLFIALKGAAGDDEGNQAKKAITILKGKLIKVESYELSDQAKRINLYYQKIAKGDKKYPRAYALIKKKPL